MATRIRCRDLIGRQCKLPAGLDVPTDYDPHRRIPEGAICEVVNTWRGMFRLAWTQDTKTGWTTTYTGWVRRGLFCLIAPKDEIDEVRRNRKRASAH